LLTAGAAIALQGSPDAADLAPGYYGAPQRFFVFNWAGAFVGATLGYEWGSVDNDPTHHPRAAAKRR
jgi:opacity protein-like surface antigen